MTSLLTSREPSQPKGKIEFSSTANNRTQLPMTLKIIIIRRFSWCRISDVTFNVTCEPSQPKGKIEFSSTANNRTQLPMTLKIIIIRRFSSCRISEVPFNVTCELSLTEFSSTAKNRTNSVSQVRQKV